MPRPADHGPMAIPSPCGERSSLQWRLAHHVMPTSVDSWQLVRLLSHLSGSVPSVSSRSAVLVWPADAASQIRACDRATGLGCYPCLWRPLVTKRGQLTGLGRSCW